MLSVNNLSIQILKNINFSLADNENLTILGANGSGKTTLAKALCYLLPTQSVSLNKKNIALITDKQRASLINFIPAKLAIYDEHLTVFDYLMLNKVDEKIVYDFDKILELLEISHLKHSNCATISSGESALVMIGGAMIHGAKYTIFDEPTANLDQKKKVKLYHLLKKSSYFQNKIIITHDLNLAYQLGYKVLHLENGEVRFFGECKDFFEPAQIKNHFGNFIKNIDGNFMVNYNEAN